MKIIKYAVILQFASLICTTSLIAQHDHGPEKQAGVPSGQILSFSHVLSQALSDPQLVDYRVDATVMTIAPGATDTVSHRHDCELFGYVLEGEVSIGLGREEPVAYANGQMFYEKRNVLHTLTRNVNSEAEAKVLLIFIIKNGRAGYTAEFGDQAK